MRFMGVAVGMWVDALGPGSTLRVARGLTARITAAAPSPAPGRRAAGGRRRRRRAGAAARHRRWSAPWRPPACSRRRRPPARRRTAPPGPTAGATGSRAGIDELRQEGAEEQQHLGVRQAHQQALQVEVGAGCGAVTAQRRRRGAAEQPQLARAEVDEIERADPADHVEPLRHEHHHRAHAGRGGRNQQGEPGGRAGQRDEARRAGPPRQRVGDDQRHVGPRRQAEQDAGGDEGDAGLRGTWTFLATASAGLKIGLGRSEFGLSRKVDRPAACGDPTSARSA